MKHLRLKIMVRRTVIFVSILIISGVSSVTSAFAIDNKYDPKFYSTQSPAIIAYSAKPSFSDGTGTVIQLSGADNEQNIYNYWTAEGLSPAQAAGITGSLQAESGFSPFRQEDGATWPEQGYGIAQFTGGQRTAVTQALQSTLGDTFTQYYVAAYGGAVTQAAGFIPSGVPEAVNDSFLKGELDYLSTLMQGLTPNPTYPTRASGMHTDFPDLTIASGEKLVDYIKSLQSASQVAEAWTYLYEQPGGDIKATATTRATNAEQILTTYGNSGGADNCSSIGSGGLTYAQALQLNNDYYTDRNQFLTGSIYQEIPANPSKKDPGSSGKSNQCTAYTLYINTIINATYGSPNGTDVANKLLTTFPNFYKSVTKDQIQPFTTYSWATTKSSDGEPGHTGVILGIESDGSIVVGESNVSYGGTVPKGLIESKLVGSRDDQIKGAVLTEHWDSVDDWIAGFSSVGGYTNPRFAAPVDGASAAQKIQAVLGSS